MSVLTVHSYSYSGGVWGVTKILVVYAQTQRGKELTFCMDLKKVSS